MKNELVHDLSQRTAIAAFAGAATIQLVAALRAGDARHVQMNGMGVAINVIAALFYQWMTQEPDDLRREALRHGDWLLTTSLLVAELYLLTDNSTPLSTALPLTVAMIVLGFVALQLRDRGKKSWIACFAASCVLFVALVAVSASGARKERGALAVFFALWAAYPLVFLAPPSFAPPAFSVLDMCSKALYGIWVAQREEH